MIENINFKSINLYNYCREKLTTLMTIIQKSEDSDLFFCHANSCSIIVYRGEKSLVIDYLWSRNIDKIHNRIEKWESVIKGEYKITYLQTLKAMPRYIGFFDQENNFRVHVGSEGDWQGLITLAQEGKLPAENKQLPPGWNESYMSIINDLFNKRTDL